ncbi:hypothetical protein OIE73_00980 [Streptomyces hirsutus]|uniref:Uncharacterized protein n=1 Tax=Streptomyces hirsutus TaxID=35620 RepID=A0ABZ1GET2_9ACTN|nr:hypothetical protein [Streptomyces hirsutus]WSD04475.1 hypothetical protein OIE73_00980 [Streptomyces hirsutus]
MRRWAGFRARTVTARHRPVMDVVDVPYELVRWSARRSEQSAANHSALEDTRSASNSLSGSTVAAVVTGRPFP